MRKRLTFVFPIVPFLMMAACSDETNEPIQNEEAVDIEPEREQQEDLENEDTEAEETEIEEADHSESEREDGPIHDEMFVDAPFLLHTDVNFLDNVSNEVMMVDIERTEEEIARADQFLLSLQQSDTTQNDIFSAIDETSMDEGNALLYFSFDGPMSMASTESAIFLDKLHYTADMYGIETLFFFEDGEPGAMFGELAEMEAEDVEVTPNRGYYVYEQDGDSTFARIADIEDIDENQDFNETLEAMQTVTAHEEHFQPGISNLVTIHDAWTDDEGTAQVHYAVTDAESWNDEDENVFFKALQLTALDFGAERLRLVDEENEEIIDYRLLEE
ncbi:hypothetical protein JCM19037_2084 [Geomicrobium sp. JCM 19037]|uniref:hypothetical protein n=1 Tax=Geomicrobium sp. JCM 19037 TaxID=1460634 RepID=UPI00045F35C4|nr:hypothetical protein [Geomicrobium sp. JCM 19037]GAK03740.1 hypothetical protein JCM19037_2084 [Geomicrobium sp. JCM 19037]